jgi:hypothetical protein
MTDRTSTKNDTTDVKNSKAAANTAVAEPPARPDPQHIALIYQPEKLSRIDIFPETGPRIIPFPSPQAKEYLDDPQLRPDNRDLALEAITLLPGDTNFLPIEKWRAANSHEATRKQLLWLVEQQALEVLEMQDYADDGNPTTFHFSESHAIKLIKHSVDLQWLRLSAPQEMRQRVKKVLLEQINKLEKEEKARERRGQVDDD